jgi:hypothetical protein
LIPAILEAPMLVAVWTTGLASTITFGSGAIPANLPTSMRHWTRPQESTANSPQASGARKEWIKT